MRWPVLASLAAAALLLAAGPAKADVAGPPPVAVRVASAPVLQADGLAATVALQPKDGPGVYSVQVGIAPARVEATWTAVQDPRAWALHAAEVRSNATWAFEAVADPPARAWMPTTGHDASAVRTAAAHPASVAPREAVPDAAGGPTSGNWRIQVRHPAGGGTHAAAGASGEAFQAAQAIALPLQPQDSHAPAGAAGPAEAWHAESPVAASVQHAFLPAAAHWQVRQVPAVAPQQAEPGGAEPAAPASKLSPAIAAPMPGAEATVPPVGPDVLHAVVWSSPTTVAVDGERGLHIFVPSGDLEALGLREPAEPARQDEARRGAQDGTQGGRPDTGAGRAPQGPPLVFLRIVYAEHADSLVVHVGGEGPAAEVPLALPVQGSGPDGAALALACATVAAAGLGLVAWLRCRGFDLPLPPAFLWLFTRLRRPELLENETRRRIHEAVEAEPGIQYAPLRRRLGLPAGVLTHHLAVLEAHGLVASLRHGARRHLYAGARPGPAPASDPRERILGLVDGRPLAQRDIAAAMPASRQAVGYHLQALLAAGRIKRQRDRDGRWLYQPAAPQAQ